MNDDMNPENKGSLRPAAAGGPSLTPETSQDSKGSNILNAVVRQPQPESQGTGSGDVSGQPGSSHEGGIPTSVKIGGAIAGATLLATGGAVLANEAGLFGNDDEKDSPNTITVPGENPPATIPGTNIENPNITPVVEVPPLQEKYNFGPNKEYYQEYLDGKLWTGVVEERAKGGQIQYKNLAGIDLNEVMPPLKKVIVNNPESLQRALLISDEIKKSNILADNKTDEAELGEVVARVDAKIATGELKFEKNIGVVLVSVPTGMTEASRTLQVGKVEDDNTILYEIFLPNNSTPFGLRQGFVTAIAADASGEIAATGNLQRPGDYTENVRRPLVHMFALQVITDGVFSVE